jgi:hypothetical protein
MERYTLEVFEAYRKEKDEKAAKKRRSAGRGQRRRLPAAPGSLTVATPATSRRPGPSSAMRGAAGA